MADIARKPFDMTEPMPAAFGSGSWAFWLTLADPALYAFVEALPQVSNLHYEDVWQRAMVTLSPLYDYELAWLWVYGQLEAETSLVALDARWDMDCEAQS